MICMLIYSPLTPALSPLAGRGRKGSEPTEYTDP